MSASSIGKRGAGELLGSRAGFVSRLTADAVDLGVLLVAWLTGLLLASAARFVLLGPPFVMVSVPPGIEGVITFSTCVLYLSYFWATTGRTPGKQLLGLRVVDPMERRLGTWRAVARAILYCLFPLGLLWVLVSRRNASIQDLLVRSAVAYDWTYRVPSSPAPSSGSSPSGGG
jgi:uncharacterized RDD family membrane protein YckC